MAMAWHIDTWAGSKMEFSNKRSWCLRWVGGNPVTSFCNELVDASLDLPAHSQKDDGEKQSLKEKMQQMQEISLKVQTGLGMLAHILESVGNAFNFSVPVSVCSPVKFRPIICCHHPSRNMSIIVNCWVGD